MRVRLSTGGFHVYFPATGTPVNLKVRKSDGSGGAAASTFVLTGGMGSPQIVNVSCDAADINRVGGCLFWIEDGTNVIVGTGDVDVIPAFAWDTGFIDGACRGDIGMAAPNMDVQLAAIGPGLTAAGVRAAIGLAAANLDTQLAAIGPGLTAAGVRAAIGLAAANLDTQLAAAPALLLDLANGVEATITLRQALRAIGAVLAGEAAVSGGHSVYKAVGNPATTRVDGTTPGSGVRSAVALTL